MAVVFGVPAGMVRIRHAGRRRKNSFPCATTSTLRPCRFTDVMGPVKTGMSTHRPRRGPRTP